MHASRAASMRMHGLAVYAIHNSPPREALPCHGLLPRTIRRSLLWLVHDHARRHASPSQAHLCSVPDRCTPNEGYIAHSRRLARRLRRTGTVASRRVSCSCRSAVVVSTCTRRRHGLVSGMHTATQSHTLIHAHSRQFDVHSCRILCVLRWRCESKAYTSLVPTLVAASARGTVLPAALTMYTPPMNGLALSRACRDIASSGLRAQGTWTMLERLTALTQSLSALMGVPHSCSGL